MTQASPPRSTATADGNEGHPHILVQVSIDPCSGLLYLKGNKIRNQRVSGECANKRSLFPDHVSVADSRTSMCAHAWHVRVDVRMLMCVSANKRGLLLRCWQPCWVCVYIMQIREKFLFF